jgi:hypothetical protein
MNYELCLGHFEIGILNLFLFTESIPENKLQNQKAN